MSYAGTDKSCLVIQRLGTALRKKAETNYFLSYLQIIDQLKIVIRFPDHTQYYFNYLDFLIANVLFLTHNFIFGDFPSILTAFS